MANQKYDNLTVLMVTGGLNWLNDAINAYLLKDAVFDTTDTSLAQTGGSMLTYVPVGGRSISSAGLLGMPVSFNRVPKDEALQVVLAKDNGPGTDPTLIAFYDTDAEHQPLMLQNNGSLIVRPELYDNQDPPQLGIWVKI